MSEKLFGTLAADLLKRHLDHEVAASTKVVIDYLSEAERNALHRALMTEATRTIELAARQASYRLKALPGAYVDLLPVLERAKGTVDPDANQGTDGFASALRDHFASGMGARPRVLVTITSEGNETQRSASDSAVDRGLITRRALCEALWTKRGRELSASQAGVLEPFLRREDTARSSLPETIGKLSRFLDRLEQLPRDEGGQALPELGSFFADSSPDWDKAGRKSASRLEENADCYETVAALHANPLEDAKERLKQQFDDQTVKTLDRAGNSGLTEVNFADVGFRESEEKKSKIQFETKTIAIRDDRHWHLIETESRPIVCLAQSSSSTLTLSLTRPLQGKETVHLVGVDPRRGGPKGLPGAVKTRQERGTVEVEIPDVAEFTVYRLIVSGGPRSYGRDIDHLWVVVYPNDESVAVEVDGRLDLKSQGWVASDVQASFEVFRRDGTRSVETHPKPAQSSESTFDEDDLEGEDLISRLKLDGGRLQPRVFWPDPDGSPESADQSSAYPFLEAAPYHRLNVDSRQRLTTALQSTQRYLGVVTSVKVRDEEWVVTLADKAQIRLTRSNERNEEEAVAILLQAPATRLLRKQRGDGADWEHVDFEELEPTSRFLELRRQLFDALFAAAMRVRYTNPGDIGLAIPLMLVDLEVHRKLIDDYAESWVECFRASTNGRVAFTRRHAELLHLDALEHRDEDGSFRSITVLPTHPWLLKAMLEFQSLISEEFGAMSTSQRSRYGLHLHRAEVLQLASPSPTDEWYVGGDNAQRLIRADSPPFHWSFLRKSDFHQTGGLGYLSRVVRNKIRRYLQMHRHLAHARRTLRIGFINAGDGQHLLDGIRDYLADEVKASTVEIEEFIPSIEVLLFSDHPGDTGRAFDRFFADSLHDPKDHLPSQLLLQKLAYLKKDHPCPQSDADFVHICFYQGMANDDRGDAKDREISDGWDAAFLDGLLATPLRETRRDGDRHRTERGVWLGSQSHPVRAGIAMLQALLRGQRCGTVDPELMLAWGAPLPSLERLKPMYSHSDWVVHLDRTVGLDLFQEFQKQSADRNEEGVTVIEYSDQEDPDTPGYDTITVTCNARPYIEQLSKVLSYSGLDFDTTDEVAARCGHGLIADINSLSGSWALDFILGNVSNASWNNRLKGNVGAALAYRWLARVESQFVKERYGDDVLPLYLSLEELIRATPAANLPLKDGLFKRFSNDNDFADQDDAAAARTISDDLLVLYLTPPRESERAKLYGRIIEVKFGSYANMKDTQRKAVSQVQGTYDLLTKHLSGNADRRDAPFRHKQLAFLLKSRIEQVRAMSELHSEQIERLDVRLLSAKIASGQYDVDYTIGVGETHACGDVFLLSTKESDQPPEDVTIESDHGVRIIKLSSQTLRWLAFDESDQDTLYNAPTDTVPNLGIYGRELLPASAREAPTQASSDPEVAGSVDSVPAVHGVLAPKVSHVSPDPKPIASESTGGAAASISSPGGITVHDEEPTRPAGTPSASNEDAQTEARPRRGDLEHAQPAEDAHSHPSVKAAASAPVKIAPFDRKAVLAVVERLSRALEGHKIRLEVPPSIKEAELGPTLVRVHVKLQPGESIASVRRISEDLARDIGTLSPDVHVTNVPERHSIGVDLPIAGLGYGIDFEELVAHDSFAAAGRDLELGFCAGIDVTGKAVWVDLAKMPHGLVAGTTGSGKTVFLRQVLLTLLMQHDPNALRLRLSSSKPMDFMPFVHVPHAEGLPIADGPGGALALVRELGDEMDRRIGIISAAACDNLREYNGEVSPEEQLPYLVAVIDEYSETVLSFEARSDRAEFEKLVARLAQKSRAAGIHLVICMQRPDSTVLQGPIKSNILHRFALKLPQSHDSRVILDENGAEALLGKGDMLYKDGNGHMHRLQVPNLEKRTLRRVLADVVGGDGG
ncbi:MAG: hypothetical protein H6726_32305 [Sandaracinaceae bacterium]|nr:hypothetical protein [Sandaracinaceae bacterium]